MNTTKRILAGVVAAIIFLGYLGFVLTNPVDRVSIGVYGGAAGALAYFIVQSIRRATIRPGGAAISSFVGSLAVMLVPGFVAVAQNPNVPLGEEVAGAAGVGTGVGGILALAVMLAFYSGFGPARNRPAA